MFVVSLLLACSAPSGDTSDPGDTSDSGDTSGDTGETGDTSGDTGDTSGDTGDTSGPVTFDATWALLEPECTSCHSGRYASGALNLATRDVAYAALVGVTAAGDACGSTGEVLVTPGDVSASLLYAKLARTQDCGMFMPPLEGSPPPAYGSSGFSAEQLAVVSEWIEASAVNH